MQRGKGRLNETRKTHERHGQDTGRDQRNGNAPECPGNVLEIQPLADAGEEHQRQRETDRRSDREGDALQKVELLLDHQNGDAQYGAVGRDERQEDTQRLVERRRELLEDDLDHLHQRRNDQNEDDGLHVDDVERHEHIGLDQPGHDGGDRHDEGHGGAHAHRSLDLRRDAEEGTDAEELRQDDVVDEDGADDDREIGNRFGGNIAREDDLFHN